MGGIASAMRPIFSDRTRNEVLWCIRMRSSVQRVIIVGGGTAGWLSACLLAARRPDLSVSLVEAPDIPTIGVGEGTWPTMRETLATIGISEAEFLSACDGSFKQGSRFDGWVNGESGDSYLHPFTPPPPLDMRELLSAWRTDFSDTSFAAAMTAQSAICERHLSPRQANMPDFAGSMNYGYHLDAGKFAALLTLHATTRLGVSHIRAKVTGVVKTELGDIEAIILKDGTRLAGDLFIDCSGHAGLLIHEHLNVAWVDRSDVSFNDRALALQVPTLPHSDIASQTIGTAHRAGWIWDIALPTRRGIGCIYASRFMREDEAEAVLRAYVAEKVPSADISQLVARPLSFQTGYRAKFWQNNCIAIGLSAGFIEPLEASAIVLIELSLRALIDNYPASRAAMDIHADRFNTLFLYRWERIVDFLKLHYVLSQRQEPYWQAQRDPATIPPRLADQLLIWQDQPPSSWDFPQVNEVFSAASQHYVLYGMRPPRLVGDVLVSDAARAKLLEISQRSRSLVAALPSNRAYLSAPLAQSA